MEKVLIGTSGYDYPEWKGVFYPEDLPRKDFLSYYATQFNALELNNSFYNMPTAQRMLSFYERSEGKLSFSVKANRLLTHQVERSWQTDAAAFKSSVTPLLEKDSISALLFQFPESFHYTPDNRFYLSALINEFEGFPVVIEFRHKEWIRDSVMEGLEKRGASVAFCDMPALKNLPAGVVSEKVSPFIGPVAYIRLHGRNADAWYVKDDSPNGSSRYTYDYSVQELESFVPIIKFTIIEGKRPVVFFNNHPKGDGAKNAKMLKDMIKPIDL